MVLTAPSRLDGKASDQPTHPQRRAGWPPTKGIIVRKLILLLALTASSTLLLGAGPANAANCTTATPGAIQRSVFAPPSWFHTSDVVTGCTGVNAVRFNTNVGTNGTQLVDLSMCSPGCFAAGPYKYDSYTYPSIPNPEVVLGTNNFHGTAEYGCWYSGSHLLTHSFTYAIRNSVGNTWGTDHTVFGPNVWTTGC